MLLEVELSDQRMWRLRRAWGALTPEEASQSSSADGQIFCSLLSEVLSPLSYIFSFWSRFVGTVWENIQPPALRACQSNALKGRKSRQQENSAGERRAAGLITAGHYTPQFPTPEISPVGRGFNN